MDPKEPEKLNLSKSQVLAVIDRRIKEWKKNWRDNKIYIIEAYAVKALIKSSPEDKFSHFWEVLIKDIDSIRYENAKQELPDTFRKMSDTKNEYSLDLARSIRNGV